MAKIWIEKIEFSDNTEIEINKNDIVVFVGPNNTGKSAVLRDIVNLIEANNDNGIVLNSLVIKKEGTLDELKNDVRLISKNTSDGNLIKFEGSGFAIYEHMLESAWQDVSRGVRSLKSIFIKTLTTQDRISAADSPKSISLIDRSPVHPIHYLQKDDLLEMRFSKYFKKAFGLDLIVHRNAGSEVPVYVGLRPVPKDGEDRVSRTYIKELEKLDLLSEQGDGMRSFVGVLLNAFVSHHSILMIDEPEAFLHPPQARKLGNMLAKDLPSNGQLFLATHSQDFLNGLLDANSNNLKIIRLERNNSVNHAYVLDNMDLKSVWGDSLLRHSNILSGLFHSQVVICESDSDCRFFSALLISLYEDTEDLTPDVLFVHCGGKHRIPVAVKALRKLNVPVKVIADFDVLNNINPIEKIYTELGGNWKDVEKDWKLVKNEIESKKPEFLKDDLKFEVEKIFLLSEEKIFPKSSISKIQKALKKSSAWSIAKEVGKGYIPSGDATTAFNDIQIKFKEKGFFILEVGELECFVKSVGNHGPKWISEVLNKDLNKDQELEIARKFILEVLK